MILVNILLIDTKVMAVAIPPKQVSDQSGESRKHIHNPALNEYLDSIGVSGPAIIKFYADWCGTCQIYKPRFEQAAKDYANNPSIKFLEIDVDDRHYSKLVREMKVSVIPMTVFVNADRTQVKKQLGNVSVSKLHHKADELLSQ